MNNLKFIKRIILIVIFIQIIMIGIVLGTSTIQDMTLATNCINSYNEGWSIEYGDGRVENDVSIPYYGKSSSNETVIARNIINEELSGKTLSFYSADKNINILVDGESIYSFGENDSYKFGHTSGSITVFADIPDNSVGKELTIEMKSYYENYATYMKDYICGDRDVIVLYYIKEKLGPLFISVSLLITGIIILILGTFLRLTNQKSEHLFCIGIFLIIFSSYHIIESKMLMVFYGNQYLYSNLVFLSLMMAPFFFEMYVYFITDRFKKAAVVLLIVSGINICAQCVLHLSGLVDFFNMAFISHGILAMAMTVLLIHNLCEAIVNKRISLALLGTIIMIAMGAGDIIRNYTVKVGDFGMYSRIGALIFSICLIITFFNEMVRNQIEDAEKAKMELSTSEIIQTLVAAIDAKDIYTKGHSTRVAQYSMMFAKELGWDEERINNVRYKALLHDVGKIGVPDRVLNKADRLSDEEFEIIKGHTIIGSDMLENVSTLSDMHLVARNHHERYDGKGYPDRLEGKNIPEEARLVGIADSYDAMSSDRAYRKALPKHVIREELVKGRGTQFDPNMVDVFIRMFDNGMLDSVSSEYKTTEKYNDIGMILNRMVEEKLTPGAIKIDTEDIGMICKYIYGIHDRYNISYNTVLISLEWEDEVLISEIDDAMKAMEYSIMQSLRKTDVMTRISESQFLLVLTEAHDENLRMILERIFASFYRNSLNTKIKPSYDLNLSNK